MVKSLNNHCVWLLFVLLFISITSIVYSRLPSTNDCNAKLSLSESRVLTLETLAKQLEKEQKEQEQRHTSEIHKFEVLIEEKQQERENALCSDQVDLFKQFSLFEPPHTAIPLRLAHPENKCSGSCAFF